MQVVGRVERLHRYPVKSLRGESPDEVEVDRALSPGAALDDALTGQVGRPVRLAEEEDVAHHDDSPVHLVTDASSRSVGADPACFRANLVVSALGAAGFVEDAWVGRDLAVRARHRAKSA